MLLVDAAALRLIAARYCAIRFDAVADIAAAMLPLPFAASRRHAYDMPPLRAASVCLC